MMEEVLERPTSGTIGKPPTLKKGSNEESQAAVAIGNFGEEFGVRRRAVLWKKKVEHKRQLNDLGLSNLAHVHDCFIRADATGEGLDEDEFVFAFKNVFPPWKVALDSSVARQHLMDLFIKIDANGDGRVSWEEFSSYVLSEGIQKTNQHGHLHGLQINVFRDPLPDDPYTDPSAYHKEMIHSVRYLKDIQKYITCGRDGTARVWSANTRRHLHTIQISKRNPPSWITCCTEVKGVFSAKHPHGFLAVFAFDGTMQLYDLRRFAHVRTIEVGDGFSPLCCDSFHHVAMLRGRHTARELLVAGQTDGKVVMYEQNDELLEGHPTPIVIRPHTDQVTEIKYVAGIDRVVSTSCDGQVCLWDCATNTTRYFQGHLKAVHCFAFCEPYKYIASGGQERDILLWNPYTLRRITSLHGHEARVQSIVFNENHNHVISLSADKVVMVWDPKSYDLLSRVQSSEHLRLDDSFSAMCWDHTASRLVLAHARFQVWPYRSDVSDGKLGIARHKAKLVAAAYNPLFEKIVTVDQDGLILVWEVETGGQKSAFPSAKAVAGEVTAAAFDVSWRRLLLGTSTGRVLVYNWNSWVCLNQLTTPRSKSAEAEEEAAAAVRCGVKAGALSSEGRWHASRPQSAKEPEGDRRDREAHAPGKEGDDKAGEITCVRNLEHQGRRLTVATGWDKVLYVWKDPPEAYEEACYLTIHPGHKAEVLCMTGIDNPGVVAVGLYDGKVMCWNTQGSWRRRMMVQACARSDDSFEGRDTCGINTMVVMHCFGPHPMFATGGMDGQVRILDSLDGRLCGQFDASSVVATAGGQKEVAPIMAMAADHNEHLIYTGDSEGVVHGFDVQKATDEVIWLQVRVVRATGLMAADANGLSDPYVKLQYGRHNEQTSIKKMTLEPEWHEEFDFRVGSGRRADILRRPGSLTLKCMDYDRFAGHDALGELSINLKQLELGKTVCQWYDWQAPSADLAHKEHGKVWLEITLSVIWHQPETFSLFKAHAGAVTAIHFTERGESEARHKPLLVTAGQDNCVQVWTLQGEHVGRLGRNLWTEQTISKIIRSRSQKRAMVLLTREHKEKERLAEIKAQRRAALAHAPAASEQLQLPDEESTELEEEEGGVELELLQRSVAGSVHSASRPSPPTETPRSISGPRASISGGLSAGVEGKRVVTDMPRGAYEVLSQPLLDQILERRGQLPEDKSLIFTRMHIQGYSHRRYAVKEAAQYGWDLGVMEAQGSLTRERVQYHMADVERVAWTNGMAPHSEEAEQPTLIKQRPTGMLALVYHSDAANGAGQEGRGDKGGGAESRGESPVAGEPSTGTLSQAPSRLPSAPTDPPPRRPPPSAGGVRGQGAGAAGSGKGGVAGGGGLTVNLKKMLTLSLPPQRPEGSWRYMHRPLPHHVPAPLLSARPRTCGSDLGCGGGGRRSGGRGRRSGGRCETTAPPRASTPLSTSTTPPPRPASTLPCSPPPAARRRCCWRRAGGAGAGRGRGGSGRRQRAPASRPPPATPSPSTSSPPPNPLPPSRSPPATGCGRRRGEGEGGGGSGAGEAGGGLGRRGPLLAPMLPHTRSRSRQPLQRKVGGREEGGGGEAGRGALDPSRPPLRAPFPNIPLRSPRARSPRGGSGPAGRPGPDLASLS